MAQVPTEKEEEPCFYAEPPGRTGTTLNVDLIVGSLLTWCSSELAEALPWPAPVAG